MNNENVNAESFSSLVSSLQQDLVRLLDAEKALAREEIAGKIRELQRDAMLFGAGALLAGLTLLCLVAAGILALSLVMAPWAAALVVGGSLGVIGLILLTTFRSRVKHLDPVPRQAVASVKRDVRAVREAVR
jgi:hypothetical protein